MTLNGLILMANAGVAINAIHVVIGAVVIAPGFESIRRTALGIVNGNEEWQRGLLQVGRGYAALIPAAAIAGAGLAVGEFPGAGSALVRWRADAMSVLATSLAVFAWKRMTVQKRKLVM